MYELKSWYQQLVAGSIELYSDTNRTTKDSAYNAGFSPTGYLYRVVYMQEHDLQGMLENADFENTWVFTANFVPIILLYAVGKP